MAKNVHNNAPLQRQKKLISNVKPNVLVMPGLQSANLSAKLMRELGGDQVIGPMLLGMERQVQVATMASSTSDLVTLAVLAAAGVTE